MVTTEVSLAVVGGGVLTRPGRFVAVAEDLETRRKIAKEGRLYLLALVCATAGALTVYVTDRLVVGIFAFLVAVLFRGPILYTYEKRHQKRLKK
jgi:hypothetical protein